MKTIHLLIILVISLSILIIAPTNLVSAQKTDFVAVRGASIPDSQIDGNIGPEWNDASSYTDVSIALQGIAHVWIKQDGTYLYLALEFLADSTDPWIALEFGNSACMSANADGALFNSDNFCPNSYSDISYTQNAGVASDECQDGKGAISVNASKFVSLELKKPLSCNDTPGKDVSWAEGNTYSILMTWDSNGGGSSGGATNHANQAPPAQTILISSKPIPEFPYPMLTLGVLIASISLVLLAYRKKLMISPKL
jgi:hypothetical protein